MSKKLTKARANLVMAHPFFGTLALRLKFKESTEFPLVATDGEYIYYNPKEIEKLPLSKLQGAIAHEVMHVAMLHHTRRGNRDPQKWNMACDFAINSILSKAGMDLPKGILKDAKYDGLSSEAIYSMLPNPPKSSCLDPGGDGAVVDSPRSTSRGATQSQQQQEETEWKQALAQAAYVAKQAGKLPEGIERMVEEVLQPVFPWREVLRRFMTEKSNDDFSWQKGNRRFIAQGMYLPSRLSTDAMKTIVIAIDTSGSISNKELSEFAAEIKSIHQETQPKELIIIYCDAKINRVDRFGPHDEVSITPSGGGGTNFNPPFDWLYENSIFPSAMVYLTDGYGDFPESDPEFPVLWCINNHKVVPPFGEHLVLEV